MFEEESFGGSVAVTGGLLELTDVVIANTSSSHHGGAIMTAGAASAHLRNVRIHGAQASGKTYVEHGGSGGRVAGPIANQVIHALRDTGHLSGGEASR